MSRLSIVRASLSVLALSAMVFASVAFPGSLVRAVQLDVDCATGIPDDASVNSTPAATPDLAATFPEEGELTIFAAASLTDAFTEIGDDITAQHPGITFTFNFAGSQTLATQLGQGAPADVFASANWTQMQVAIDADKVAGEPHTFTRNRLAIVVPASNPAGISEPADLAQNDLRLVLAQPEVPVGRYSIDSICGMAADPTTYGDDFADRVHANVVSYEEDVRAVLTKVQLGEADAGIVYASDISDDVADDVVIIEIPEDVNVIASYPVAAVDPDNALALAFIAYVLGPEGQETLIDHGFTPLS